MKNRWTIFFSGHVKIKIMGKGIERLLNECVRKDILIWDLVRHLDSSVTFYTDLKNVHNIRRVIRKSGCKLSFIGGHGLPFLIKRALFNSGFVIGLFSCFVILFILSNMVWNIEIKGAKPETEHIIRKELKEIGLEKGKFQFMITDVEEIQKHLSTSIHEITWVGVDLIGTTYHFQVVEKNQPEKPEYFSARHLVARKNAFISYMYVEEGQSMVSLNSYVQKGDLLVSGVIGQEGKTELVSARGKIFGETWYRADISVPLNTSFHVLSGNSKTMHYLNVGKWRIKVWGFGKPSYSSYEKSFVNHPFYFLKWKLPFEYSKQIVWESERVNRKYTKIEAIMAGMTNARSDLKRKLDEQATIKGEKILRESLENGKVKLSIHYQVIEEISSVQPIIQGD